MAALKSLLPYPKNSTSTMFYDHSNDPWFKQRFGSSLEDKPKAINAKPVIPPYMKRASFVPRKVEDFGDGGAFPEIHIAQYPLGRVKPGSKTLHVTVDDHGDLAYDAIVEQNENGKKIVYSQHKDLVPKILRDEEEEEGGDEEEIEATTQETKAALEKILNARLNNVPRQSSDSKYVKYKPSQQSVEFNSGAEERMIRMVDMPVDPLEPSKFKNKKVPKGSGSPPVPVTQSPPRPATVTDKQDWSIPPCISNWVNPKGYTIPLDKRLAADGRGLEEVRINDKFAKLCEAVYVAEQKGREAVAMRAKVQKEMMMKEKERKERELRALAAKARSERTVTVVTVAAASADVPLSSISNAMDTDMSKESKQEGEELLQREKIREGRRRERERERRLEAKEAAMGKTSKITRDRDRDISEKVALGMACIGAGRGGEVMYDQRLFNQEKGMDSGFAADDQYNIYEKGLFSAQPTLTTLYRPKKDMDSDMYGVADEQIERIRKTERFKPDKEFSGTCETRGPRERPVEFEKQAEEADPFGLDQFLTEVKRGKRAMEKVGAGGTMKASAGSTI
ncbi:hypothetical protein PTKIN_Ptkin14bG0050500 [Pterospermum kingtungense]